MTLGAGFLMRPLEAIVSGGYIDRVGLGLIVTFSIIAIGAVAKGSYQPRDDRPVGLFLVLIRRSFQGFSAGVELGGVSVYLSETAPQTARLCM
jgi:MFS transporter, MHS family, citrate/tricarballylate:H+ symporter